MRLLISLGLLSLVLCSIRAEDDWQCPKPNGYFINPKDPHKFYECVSGHPYPWTCPEGLVFNENIKACDYTVGPIVVRTSTTVFSYTAIRAKDDWQCPKPNGYFINPKDPHKFYECVSGHPYPWTCPEGLVFNESIKACDYTVGPILVHTTSQPNMVTRQRHDSTSPTTGTSANSNSTITPSTNTTVSSKTNSTVNPVTEAGR